MQRLFSSALVLCLSLALAAGCSTAPSGDAGSASKQSQKRAAKASRSSAPRKAQEQYDKTLVLMQVEDFAGAERAFSLFVEKYPGYAGPWINLGIIYTRTDRLELAEAAFSNAVESNPSNPVAWNELGIIYRRTGRFTEAEQAYMQAIDLSADFAAPELNLGVLYDLYLQQPDKALVHYERYQALENNDDQLVAKWIAELKMRIGSEQRTARMTQ